MDSLPLELFRKIVSYMEEANETDFQRRRRLTKESKLTILNSRLACYIFKVELDPAFARVLNEVFFDNSRKGMQRFKKLAASEFATSIHTLCIDGSYFAGDPRMLKWYVQKGLRSFPNLRHIEYRVGEDPSRLNPIGYALKWSGITLESFSTPLKGNNAKLMDTKSARDLFGEYEGPGVFVLAPPFRQLTQLRLNWQERLGRNFRSLLTQMPSLQLLELAVGKYGSFLDLFGGGNGDVFAPPGLQELRLMFDSRRPVHLYEIYRTVDQVKGSFKRLALGDLASAGGDLIWTSFVQDVARMVRLDRLWLLNPVEYVLKPRCIPTWPLNPENIQEWRLFHAAKQVEFASLDCNIRTIHDGRPWPDRVGPDDGWKYSGFAAFEDLEKEEAFDLWGEYKGGVGYTSD